MKLNWLYSKLREAYSVPEKAEKKNKINLLIETVLSQNTNDNNRDIAMENLLEAFNSSEEILRAERVDIYEKIKVAGLGNIKSKRIQEILKKIKQRNGEININFLDDMSTEKAREWLLKLPGVGFKTASVVLNFGFNKSLFPVDTHCKRVLKRTGVVDENLKPSEISIYVEKNYSADKLYPLHINVIRHGREICKAPNPLCEDCFLTEKCKYFREHKS